MFNSNPFDPNPHISNIMRNMPGHCLTPADTLKMDLMDSSPSYPTLNYQQKYNIGKGYPVGNCGMPLPEKTEYLAGDNIFKADGSLDMHALNIHVAYQLAIGNKSWVEAYNEHLKRKK